MSLISCSHNECEETIKDSKFDKIKSNWFYAKDGSSYCPKHTPEWVAEWRAKKALAAEGNKKPLIERLDRAHKMSVSDYNDPECKTLYSEARDALKELKEELEKLKGNDK